jgi:phage host-nuclease inhibitor protein Gam
MNELTFGDLVDDLDGVTQEVSTDFAVTDLASADWCLRKVAASERRMQVRHALVEQRKTEMDAWEARANKADLNTADRMAEYLRPWAEHEVAEGGRKSVSLPTGTVGFRWSPDSIEVLDTQRVIAQLETLCRTDLVRVITREEVDKRGLMAHVKAGGALPEGCELREGERKFYMKVGEKA